MKGYKTGWSATKLACDVIEDVFRIAQGKDAQDKKMPSNVWFNPNTNQWYMAEWGEKEYDDGHISGKVSRFSGNPIGQERCSAYPVGSLYIEPCGRIRYWPGMLAAIINAVNLTL